MDNSLLVSLSQQLAAYRSMDVIANNLANVSTPGFKREAAKFEEFITRVRPSESQTGPQSVSFVKDAGIMRDISDGEMQHTGATFDMAISGSGFFVVQTPQGERFTRNGHFTLDAGGQVTTSDGNPVQGDGGAITITPDDGIVNIGADGTVSGKTGQIANPIISAVYRVQPMGARRQHHLAHNCPEILAPRHGQGAHVFQQIVAAQDQAFRTRPRDGVKI